MESQLSLIINIDLHRLWGLERGKHKMNNKIAGVMGVSQLDYVGVVSPIRRIIELGE